MDETSKSDSLQGLLRLPPSSLISQALYDIYHSELSSLRRPDQREIAWHRANRRLRFHPRSDLDAIVTAAVVTPVTSVTIENSGFNISETG